MILLTHGRRLERQSHMVARYALTLIMSIAASVTAVEREGEEEEEKEKMDHVAVSNV